MVKALGTVIAVALLTLPASAQVQSQQGGKITVPSAQNSGVGIQGERGSKAGPAPQKPETSGVREQDSAKIPGKPGGKSGPAVMPPSGTPDKQR